MGSKWKAYRLGDLVTHQKGHAFKSKDYKEHGHGTVRVSDFTNRYVDTDSCNYLAQERTQNYDSVALKHGNVVVATVGSWPTNPASVVGKTIQVPREADSFLLNQNAVKLTANESLDQAFLFHLLKTRTFQAYIVSAAQGSASQASFTLKSIFDYSAPLPPLAEQKAIAHILGSLDDKIELNRRMNGTLEGMAQALLKSWFVDFDPVIDNALAAGNPVPDELADRADVRRKALADGTANREAAKAFPAAFQQTETMGWIPEGWDEQRLYDIANFVNGAAYKSADFSDLTEALPVIKIAETKAGITAQIKFTEMNKGDRYRISSGDIVLSWSGNLDTSMDTVIWSDGPSYLSQYIFSVCLHQESDRFFVYYQLKHLRFTL